MRFDQWGKCRADPKYLQGVNITPDICEAKNESDRSMDLHCKVDLQSTVLARQYSGFFIVNIHIHFISIW